MLSKVLKLFTSGKYRTLPDMANKLDVTVDELKGILNILVATGKLKVTSQNLGGNQTGCSGCSDCAGGCLVSTTCDTPAKKNGNSHDIPNNRDVRFYELRS